MTPAKKSSAPVKFSPPPLSVIYRRIAISFVVLTVLLVGIIVFFSMSKATIVVVPKEDIRSAEFLLTAKKQPQGDANEIRGLYTEQTVEEEGQFEATGTSEKQGRAEGVITVVNTTNFDQPLVETTRFLSSGEVLFRTAERIVVPANGEIKVRVRADEPGPGGDIAPAKFIIPGLNSAKQKLIYGESDSAMSGGAQSVRIVTEQDIEQAKLEVVEQAKKRVQSEFEATPEAGLGGVTVETEVLQTTVDTKAGEERQTFATRVKMKVIILAYDKSALEKIAEAKVRANIPSDRDLVQFHSDAMLVRVRNVNADTQEAQLAVYADGKVRITTASPILDPIKIAGMTPVEAEQYLRSFDAVEDIQIDLFPSWQKSIPTIPDRIKIMIQK